jgi:ribonuclease HI
VGPVQAFRPIHNRAQVELYVDSEFLIYGMRSFVMRWQRQGWRNRRGSPLQHRQLWGELLALNARLCVGWTWLRGHNGHREQTRPDVLAFQAAGALWVRQKGVA